MVSHLEQRQALEQHRPLGPGAALANRPALVVVGNRRLDGRHRPRHVGHTDKYGHTDEAILIRPRCVFGVPSALTGGGPRLGFGRIVVSEIEVPNMLVNLV